MVITINRSDLISVNESDIVFVDQENRPYFEVQDHEQVEVHYLNAQRVFWSERRGSPETEKLIIEQQEPDYFYGTKSTLSDFLQGVVRQARKTDQAEISILELGCANAPTLRHLNKVAPKLNVDFTGLELTECLVSDANVRYPHARITVGGAEEMIGMTGHDLGRDRFDVFLAVGVLCQMPPNVVRDVLNYVSQYCDTILVWDYLLNLDGELSTDNPVIFKHYETANHILFVNPYRKLLHEAGFEIEKIRHFYGDGIAAKSSGEEDERKARTGTGAFRATKKL